MDFNLNDQHITLQNTCRELAASFRARAERRDREASLPEENDAELRAAGLLSLLIPRVYGGQEVGLPGPGQPARTRFGCRGGRFAACEPPVVSALPREVMP